MSVIEQKRKIAGGNEIIRHSNTFFSKSARLADVALQDFLNVFEATFMKYLEPIKF